MAATGSVKAASAVEARSWPGTDLIRSRFFARVQTSRERIAARTYKRDAEGQFSSGGGSGDDFDDDEDGAAETEPDEYEDGLSSSYLEKYGGVKDHYAPDSNHAIIVPKRGRMHVADDSNGRENREVLQELTPAQARTLSNDVFDVYEGGAGRDSAAGVRVDAGGSPESVSVTWSSGRTSTYDAEDAFELQEGLGIMAGGPSNRLATLVARTRLFNHPGHRDQKSHGRKGGAKAADAQISQLGRIDPPGDIRATAMGTNPRYGGPYEGQMSPEVYVAGGATYTQNCSRVAVAYEMRRRGIDVTAGAGTPIGDTTATYVRTFRQDGRYGTRVADDLSRSMSVREVAAEVETWPHGARGIVTIQGHTLNVERHPTTGKAVFVDAQAAKNKNPVMSRAQFEARVESRGAPTGKWAAVARVDDLGLSDYGLHYVESPTLSITDGHVAKTSFPQDPTSETFSTLEEMAAMTPDDSYP